MEVLKRTIIAASLMLFGFFASAQTEAAMQKAFSESYTHEYNKLYGEAIASLTKVYDEKSYEVNLRLGWLYYMNKNYTQSQVYYQKAVTLKPYAIEAKFGLIKPLSVLEFWDKVLQQYDEILNIDPQNYTANYWLGVMQYNRKKYEAASKFFEKLVNLFPFDYDANHMLGWSYLNMGKSNEARIVFNKALLIKPADASSLEGLSKLK